LYEKGRRIGCSPVAPGKGAEIYRKRAITTDWRKRKTAKSAAPKIGKTRGRQVDVIETKCTYYWKRNNMEKLEKK